MWNLALPKAFQETKYQIHALTLVWVLSQEKQQQQQPLEIVSSKNGDRNV